MSKPGRQIPHHPCHCRVCDEDFLACNPRAKVCPKWRCQEMWSAMKEKLQREKKKSPHGAGDRASPISGPSAEGLARVYLMGI
jgi:hypothetical protein